MKTRSFLITIPRNTEIYYQQVEPTNLDTGNNSQVIDNIYGFATGRWPKIFSKSSVGGVKFLFV